MNVNSARVISLLSGIIVLFLTMNAKASVTIMGSRIIYPSSATSVDVQLKNSDKFPYVVQTWFDDGDIKSTPESSSKTPFIATPPVFRIQPQSGQVMRIVFDTSKSLPKDRESVFWFNALKIPPANADGAKGDNKMTVMLRNRIKIFYRPSDIGNPTNLVKQLEVKVIKKPKDSIDIEVTNNNPWYATASTIKAIAGSVNHSIRGEMIAPFSTQRFTFNNNQLRGDGHVAITLINDQGARVSEKYNVTW